MEIPGKNLLNLFCLLLSGIAPLAANATDDSHSAAMLALEGLEEVRILGYRGPCPTPDFFRAVRAIEPLPGRDDPPSTHGMLIFGTGPFYVSHLPMLHPPHDYQALLEVEVDPETAKKIRAHKGAPYMTIDPEEFTLAAKIAEGGDFKAKLVSGHFERGGKPMGNSRISVKRIVYFKKFVPGETGDASDYLAFGTEKEYFLAHRIGGKAGEFDQISSVADLSDEAKREIAAKDHVSLKAPKAAPLETGTLSFSLSGGTGEFSTPVKPIYTEFDDFKH